MFRRKKEDDDMKPESVTPASSDDSTVTVVDAKVASPSSPRPMPLTPPSTTTGGAASFAKPATTPVIGRAGVSWSRERTPTPPTGESTPTESKKLIVGREIVLSGQITSCDRLVVEGRVEASLTETRSIEIAETGHFKGSAEIESAEIAGRYEGTLTVRERLFIRATGKVNGKITYGQIEIEPGGEIAGEVHVGPRRGGASE